MSYESKVIYVLCCLILLSVPVFGQAVPSSTPVTPSFRTDTRGLTPEQIDYVRSREQIAWEKQQQAAMRQLELDRRASMRLPKTKPDGKPYTKAEIKRLKDLLKPTAKDLTAYKEFLGQPKTGIFRLVPDFDCMAKNLIHVDGDCKNFVLRGWSYSFRMQEHTGSNSFDIRYYKDDLICDGFLTQSVIVPLGNIPLDQISTTSDGLKFLDEFVPAAESREAKKQYAQLAVVVEANGYNYSKRVRAVENMTYAVRSIAYRSKSLNYLLGSDERRDLTATFRIVKKDENGEILVIWKELKNQNSPKLKFQKGETWFDLKQ